MCAHAHSERRTCKWPGNNIKMSLKHHYKGRTMAGGGQRCLQVFPMGFWFHTSLQWPRSQPLRKQGAACIYDPVLNYTQQVVRLNWLLNVIIPVINKAKGWGFGVRLIYLNSAMQFTFSESLVFCSWGSLTECRRSNSLSAECSCIPIPRSVYTCRNLCMAYLFGKTVMHVNSY